MACEFAAMVDAAGAQRVFLLEGEGETTSAGLRPDPLLHERL